MQIPTDIASEVWANARPTTIENEETGETTTVRRALRKGTFNRRLIAEKDIDGDNGRTYEYGYHATKGWRRRVKP